VHEAVLFPSCTGQLAIETAKNTGLAAQQYSRLVVDLMFDGT
jgi:hypothetical protein